MIIDGYSINTANKGYYTEVFHFDSGKGFTLEGKDSYQFLDKWYEYEGPDIESFLIDNRYKTLLELGEDNLNA